MSTRFQGLNLSYNPFREITPSKHSQNMVWAEMSDVKARFERLYQECINTDAKQIVLNWGPYGGGKTFSAYYFIKHYQEEEGLTQIYLRNPKDGSKATDEFFKGVIDDLTFDRICDAVSDIIEEIGEVELIRILTPIASREYAKAISLFGKNDDDVRELMNRFLYTGLTKTELKKLGLAKDIQTDTDSIKFLSGIISCFNDERIIANGRLVLWIDEMEDLIYFQPKYYKAYSQILRDLFDSISTGFLVFMNFTLAEGEEGTIEAMLGGALWSRITKRIRFKPFTVENGKVYLSELLQASKIRKSISKPMPQQIVERIIEIIPLNDLTPREINKHAGSLISFALENGVDNIDNALFDIWLEQYTED